MPDGILLAKGAVLKYINQIPHTDHCVWLPIALEIYLAETGDYALLDEKVTSMYGDTFTVFERFSRAMDWLLSSNARDDRGLSYIAQGDWCDPMNMVGVRVRDDRQCHGPGRVDVESAARTGESLRRAHQHQCSPRIRR